MTNITQADREAAVALDDALGFLIDSERPIVPQAFAAHREEAVRELVDVTEQLLFALSPLNIMGKPIASLDSALSGAIRDAVIALASHKGDE